LQYEWAAPRYEPVDAAGNAPGLGLESISTGFYAHGRAEQGIELFAVDRIEGDETRKDELLAQTLRILRDDNRVARQGFESLQLGTVYARGADREELDIRSRRKRRDA